jgi:16S rRNA (adenine1518-N6/adenine1519-N6)-dimethyltransferase
MERLFKPHATSRAELVSWTLNVLRSHGIKPKKRLSQHFVVDPRLLREIALYMNSCSDAIEIGCGIGTLSLTLLDKARSLLCIELDERLCNVACNVVADPRFLVVCGDALKFPFTREVVVSNIPYHITSKLIVKLARENSIKKIVLTVQSEVADRLIAEPGFKEYGRLTVLIRSLFDIKLGGFYPPQSFYPKPEVAHRVVVLVRKRLYTEDFEALELVTRIFFSQRRKVFEKVFVERLGVVPQEIRNLFSSVFTQRVYMIDPDTWLALAREIRLLGLI